MTEWYDFSNIKSYKMLSYDSVAEAYRLIYPRPSDENFSFAVVKTHRNVSHILESLLF